VAEIREGVIAVSYQPSAKTVVNEGGAYPCQRCHPERRFCREGPMHLLVIPMLPASTQILRFAQDDK
jgi:hypothetical protein